MGILPILPFAVAAMADSFAAGVILGTKREKGATGAGVLIAFCRLAGVTLAVLAGGWMARVIPEGLEKVLGGLTLFIFGLRMLYLAFMPPDTVFARRGDPAGSEVQPGNSIPALIRILPLGTILGLRGAALGLGAGVLGYPLPRTAILCGLLGLSFVWAGIASGKRGRREEPSVFWEICPALLAMGLGVGAFL